MTPRDDSPAIAKLRAELEGAELVNEELEKQLAECSRDYHDLRRTLSAQVRRYANKSGRLKAENQRLRAVIQKAVTEYESWDWPSNSFVVDLMQRLKQALKQTESEGE